MGRASAILNTDSDYFATWLQVYTTKGLLGFDTPAGRVRIDVGEKGTYLRDTCINLCLDGMILTPQSDDADEPLPEMPLYLNALIEFTLVPIVPGRVEVMVEFRDFVECIDFHEEGGLDFRAYFSYWAGRWKAIEQCFDDLLLAISQRWPGTEWKLLGEEDKVDYWDWPQTEPYSPPPSTNHTENAFVLSGGKMEERIVFRGTPAQFGAFAQTACDRMGHNQYQISPRASQASQSINPSSPFVGPGIIPADANPVKMYLWLDQAEARITAQGLPGGTAILFLQAKAEHWPILRPIWGLLKQEMSEQGWIEAIEQRGTEQPTTEQQREDKPQPPTSPTVLQRWRKTWLLVKGQWKQGRNYTEIDGWLETNDHEDVRCTSETFLKIMQAGERGELDNLAPKTS